MEVYECFIMYPCVLHTVPGHWLHDTDRLMATDLSTCDGIGENDGTLDVILWDEDLGEYWALVRLDAGHVGRDQNPRRTGRTTTSDLLRHTFISQYWPNNQNPPANACPTTGCARRRYPPAATGAGPLIGKTAWVPPP